MAQIHESQICTSSLCGSHGQMEIAKGLSFGGEDIVSEDEVVRLWSPIELSHSNG